MARSNVTTQKITRAGLAVAMTAPTADGDIIDAGDVALVVTNGGGAAVVVTVQTPGTVDGLAIADLAVSVPASSSREIGPFPARRFAQPAGVPVGAGRVLVDYSAVASVTRAAKSF